jgi:transposase InsO family protein
MKIFLGLGLAFFLGYFFAAFRSRRSRRLRSLFWHRKMQIIALRVTIAQLQHAHVKAQSKGKTTRRKPPWKVKLKKVKPSFSWWEKVLLSIMHHIFPSIATLLGIHTQTLVRWYKRWQQIIWKHFTQKAKRVKADQKKGRGRPPISEAVQETVCIIKKENPGYGAEQISMALKKLGEKVSSDTVVRILKKNNLPVNKPGERPKGQQNPWKNFINLQGVCSMDFKTVFDTRCRQLFILNIIEHESRKVIHSMATYHPTSAWVAQRLREIFPFDSAPKYMLLDRDKIFYPIVSRILPSMGTIVRRSAYKCPWQNGVVERFNCMLQEELLDYVIPYGDTHLNGLLEEYRCFYNTARPHMKLDGESPVKALPDTSRPTKIRELSDGRRLVSISWLWGLHHSYCWEK